jgi:hypothetical protein
MVWAQGNMGLARDTRRADLLAVLRRLRASNPPSKSCHTFLARQRPGLIPNGSNYAKPT